MHYDTPENHAETDYPLLHEKALQSASNGVVICRNEGKDRPIIWVNRAFTGLTGYAPEDVIGHDCRLLNEPWREQPAIPQIAQALREERGITTRLLNFRKDGSTFWNELHIDPVRDTHGHVTHFIGIQRDVTATIEAERRLRQSQTILENAGEIAQVGGWSWDAESHQVYWTETTKHIHEVASDYRPDYQSALSFYPEPYRQQVKQAVEAAAANGRSYRLDAEIITARGRRRWVRMSARPEMENGQCVSMHGAFQDITEQHINERKQQELSKQVLQLQRLETIGTLAGGIAHDFNNLLGTIRGWAELCQRHLEDTPKATDDLAHILTATERARSLVNQILLFSRDSEITMEAVDPGQVVREAVEMLRSTIPATIEIALEIAPDTPSILADASQIHQVMLNLCTNAYQAIGNRPGEIQIRVEGLACRDEKSLGLNRPATKYYAHIQVCDNGPGIPPRHLPRIFEPFYTTKGIGEGTGLGLSVVHGIVQSHQGHIEVESEIGQGTCFSMRFPGLPEGDRQAAATEEFASSEPQATGHILLVDDEEDLTLATARNLESLGIQVSVANSGEQALSIFQAQPDAFDVLITDQMMPHLTGLDIAKTMRQARPNLPVIIVTGFSNHVTDGSIKALGHAKLLLKPCTTRDIISAIQELH